MTYSQEEYPQPEQPQSEEPQLEQPQPEQPQPEQLQFEQPQPEQPQPIRPQPKRPQPKRAQPKRAQRAQSRKERPAQAEKPQPGKRQFSPILIGVVAIGVLLILVVLFLILRGGYPQGRALVDLNLRAGPGVAYPVQGSLKKDDQVTVVGRNKDGSWLLVETKDGKKLWVSGGSEFVQVDRAAVDRLPVVETGGVAFNASDPKVNQVLNEIPLLVYHRDHFTCASHGGLNRLLPDVVEGNIVGPNSGDFAYPGKGGAVLFRYTGGTFVLIRDNPIARFDGDKESLPLDQALQMFEKGEVVWTGHIGDWPGRGVEGCDLSAKKP
jgi:uncharacterized protein YraI